MGLKQILEKHWTVDPPAKTENEIEAERYLICIPLGRTSDRFAVLKCIRFNRWMLFSAAFLTQFCCGSLYSWSIYNQPIDQYIYGKGVVAGRAVYAFYVSCGFLGATAAVLGPWLERNGPRMGLLLGVSMFLVGHIIAAISIAYQSIAGVYIGYGAFVGFGLGINYISPVSALQKWFPDYRGIAAGFAVGGFGAGSVVWGKVYLPSAEYFGLPYSFAILGIVMSIVMYFCTIAMRTPPPDFTIEGVNIHGIDNENLPTTHSSTAQDAAIKESLMSPKDILTNFEKHEGTESLKTDVASLYNKEHYTTQEYFTIVKSLPLLKCLTSIEFFFMYFMLFGNISFGLIVLSRLSSMATTLFEQTPEEGSTIVSINGVFNCLGRLLWPMISDSFIRLLKVNPPFARKIMFFFTLCIQLIILLTLPTLIHNKDYTTFRIEIWLLTLCYGGGFGTIPCFISDMFGVYNIGAVHGLILTSWSVAGVAGGLIFTYLYNDYVTASKMKPAEAYISNINWITGILIFGFVCLFLVRTNPRDRFAHGGYQYSLFNKVIFKFGKKSN